SMDVESLAVAPARQHALCVPSHDVRVGRDPLLMKRRLDELSLAPPEFAFTQQQPIAKHAAHRAIVLRFDKIIVLRDQDRFDVVRAVHKARRHTQEAKKNDISKFPHAPGEIADRIATRLEYAAEKRNTLGA